MDSKPLEDKDFEALFKLDLANIVGLDKNDEEAVKKFTAEFNSFVWSLFIHSGEIEMTDEDIDKLIELTEAQKFQEAEDLLTLKCADLNPKIGAYSILVKQMVISTHMAKLINKLRQKKEEEKLQQILEISELVEEKKWDLFSQKLNILAQFS